MGTATVPFDPKIPLARLSDIRNSLWSDRKAIITNHPDWDPGWDARLTFGGKLINILDATCLGLVCLDRSLMLHDWWYETFPGRFSEEQRTFNARNFEIFLKIAFVNSAFHVFDSSFRLLLRAVDSSACDQGTAEFKSISDCLLNTKLGGRYGYGTPALELFRLMRNTLHNNGVFFTGTGRTRSSNIEARDTNSRSADP